MEEKIIIRRKELEESGRKLRHKRKQEDLQRKLDLERLYEDCGYYTGHKGNYSYNDCSGFASNYCPTCGKDT